jgi:hypothetical protein
MNLVRFKENERGGAWRKGEIAEIIRQISRKPLAQDDIYIVGKGDKQYWCVGSDVDPWNQLSLF